MITVIASRVSGLDISCASALENAAPARVKAGLDKRQRHVVRRIIPVECGGLYRDVTRHVRALECCALA
jgi:hypothetical protein